MEFLLVFFVEPALALELHVVRACAVFDILRSGIFFDDRPFLDNGLPKGWGKGQSLGSRWLIQPIPHRLVLELGYLCFYLSYVLVCRPPTPGWGTKQGILSSFGRLARSANLPIQVCTSTDNKPNHDLIYSCGFT